MSTKKTNPANPYTVLPMEQLVPSSLYPFARSQEDDQHEDAPRDGEAGQEGA